MKKKIFKILSVIVVIIICVSVFCISASAKTVYSNFNDFVDPVETSIRIYKNASNEYVDITGSRSLVASGSNFTYKMTTLETWGRGQDYRADFSFSLRPIFNKSRYKGDFHIWGNPDIYYFLLNNSSIYFCNSDGSVTNCSLSLNPYSNSDLVVSFDSLTVLEPVSLQISIYFSNSVTSVANSTIFDFDFMYLNFATIADSDLIIENQDKLASDIQANADKNANEIKANQDKNANKIINGGRDEPGYSSVDKSATNDYQAKEEEINNQTAEARSSTVNFFNNFGGLLNDTPVSGGLLAVSKIMTHFFSIGWLSGLIQFALGIGAFAFILGSVIMVVGKVSSRPRSERPKRK